MTSTRILALAIATTLACSRMTASTAEPSRPTDAARALPITAPVATSPLERDLSVALDSFVATLATNPDAVLAEPTEPLPAPCLAFSGLTGPLPDRAVRLRHLASDWRDGGVHSPRADGDTVEVSVGPLRPAMTTLCFHRVAGSWWAVGWIPGE